MRRMAFGFAFLWLALAFCVRLYDLRKPQVYLSALTGGQKGMFATVAWLRARCRGELVRQSARSIDGGRRQYRRGPALFEPDAAQRVA